MTIVVQLGGLRPKLPNSGMCERNSWRRYEERNLEVEDCSPTDEYGG
jgi:hypothetical protein